MKHLNLGCGDYPKEGYVNLDRRKKVGVDICHDLNMRPYPFSDGEFDLIEADHVLEHLQDVFATMEELHRILKPGGTLILKTPHFTRGYAHPGHVHGFDATFPFYFKPDFPGEYAGVHFECLSTRLTWFAQPYFKRSVLSKEMFQIARTVGIVIDAIANINPLLFSRIASYYVGGFEEISFVMRKPS